MKTVYLKTTETCNLDCSHCYTSGSKGRKIFWDIEKVKTWINKLVESLPKNESVHFEIHGGEPFICKTSDLHDVIDFIRSYQRDFTVAITSNLVFNLTEDRLSVLSKLDGIGTSWDLKGRFENEDQLNLWKNNVRLIKEKFPNIPFCCNTTISTSVILLEDISSLIQMYLDLGFDRLRFEKITLSGNAIINRDVVPTNKQANDFLYRLHLLLKDNPSIRDRLDITNMEEIYSKFENRLMNSGTYFRNCESNLYTINADGTIGGCPNDGPITNYGNITEPIEKINKSDKRIFQIVKESTLYDECYECPLNNYCGGGCYKLHWDETGCPTPKKLLFKIIEEGKTK